MPTRPFAKPSKGATVTSSSSSAAAAVVAKPAARNPAPPAPTPVETKAPSPAPAQAAPVTPSAPAPTFQDLLSKREEKARRGKAAARGATIDDRQLRGDVSLTGGSLAATDADDEDDYSMYGSGSIGIGHYAKKIVRKRGVFHQDAPDLKVFTYVNHKQIIDEVKPEAYDNFTTTRADARWKDSSEFFFEHGRIGETKDDPTVFFDPENNEAEEAQYRRSLALMSAKERRLAHKVQRGFKPPPIVPTFDRDSSFLLPPTSGLPAHQRKYKPSIFATLPYEEFTAKGQRSAAASQSHDVEEEEAEDGKFKGEKEEGNTGAGSEEVKQSSPTHEPLADVEAAKRREWSRRMTELRASAIDEWQSMHNSTAFSTTLSRLHQQRVDAGDDSASVDTFAMIYGTKDENQAYAIGSSNLDEKNYFGEAARLKFFGKYHELRSKIAKRLGEGGGGGGGGDGTIRPLQDYHLALSPRTRFITRYVETFNQMPLPIVVRPREDEQDPLRLSSGNASAAATETELNLAKMSLGDDYVSLLSETLVDLPRLQALNLAGNNLTDRSLALVTRVLEAVPGITTLNLSENKIDSKTAAALSGLLENPSSTIHTLVLASADFDDSEVALFTQCLAKNRSLQHLDFSGNRIGGGGGRASSAASKLVGCEAIATALANTRSLEYLNLNWNSIGPASAVHLSRGVAETSTLVELHLAYNCLKDAGAEAIGGALMRNAAGSLRRLDLSGNQITFAGCFVLSWSLRINDRLGILDLSANPIGNRGARTLMRTLNFPYKGEGGDREIILSKCTFSEGTTTEQVAAPAAAAGTTGTTSTTGTTGTLAAAIRDNTAVDLVHPSGEYSLDLSRVFDRALALELLLQAAMRRGCGIRRATHMVLPESRAAKPKSTTVNLVAPPRRAALQGQPYSPWKLSTPRGSHPYTQLEARDWADVVKGLAFLDAKTGQPFVLPSSGVLTVDFTYEPWAACPVDVLNATGFARLQRLVQSSIDGHRLQDLWAMCQELRLECQQLVTLVSNALPGRKRRLERIEAFAALLPCVVDVTNTELLLKRLFQNDLRAFAELRSLMHGHLFYLCFNSWSGNFKLDLALPSDRLTAIRLCEIDNEEQAYMRSAVPAWGAAPTHGFTAQHQNRSNFRNEVMSGRARMVATSTASALDADGGSGGGDGKQLPRPHQALNQPGYFARGLVNWAPGTIEFDFVSTSRPAEGARAISDHTLDSLLVARGLKAGGDAVALAVSQSLGEEYATSTATSSQQPLLRLLRQQSPNIDAASSRWLTSVTPLHELQELRGQKEAAEIAEDRACVFVDTDGANHRFVFRAVIRVHSQDLAFLSHSDAQRRANEKHSHKSHHAGAKKGGKGKKKGRAKKGGKWKPKKGKGKNADDQAEAEAEAEAEADAGGDLEAVDAAGGAAEDGEEDNDNDNDDDDDDDDHDDKETEREHESGPRLLATASGHGAGLARGAKSQAPKAQPPLGSVLEACLAFRQVTLSEHGISRSTSLHTGVGQSTSPFIVNQKAVSPRCPWLEMPEWSLTAAGGPDEAMASLQGVPTHERFSLGESGRLVVLHGTDIVLEMPVSRAATLQDGGGDEALALVEAQLKLLFCAPRDGDEGAGALRPKWTHDSTVELEHDVLTGASGGGGLAALHVITRRLDCSLGCLPSPLTAAAAGGEGGGVFKTGSHDGVQSVWRWRTVKQEDRDYLATPYTDDEPTWAWNLAPSLPLPHCWYARLAASRHAFGHVWLTCAQAARLLSTWPWALREDVAVFLFSRILDLDNFNMVADACYANKEATSALYRRIGWLNAINLMHIEGRHFDLCMSVPEERLVAHAIIIIEIKEPGKLFSDERFKRDDASAFIPGWELPASWVPAASKLEQECGAFVPFAGIPTDGRLVFKAAPLGNDPVATKDLDSFLAQRRQKLQAAAYLLAVPRGDGTQQQ